VAGDFDMKMDVQFLTDGFGNLGTGFVYIIYTDIIYKDIFYSIFFIG